MAIGSATGDREWLTLQEACEVTGIAPSSLRGAIQRGRYERVKKKRSTKGKIWLIHKDEFTKTIADRDHGIARSGSETGDRDRDPVSQENPHGVKGTLAIGDQVGDRPIGIVGEGMIVIPVEYYEGQQKEHDRLLQGMMMYRWKYEELDRQVKLLPAPVEVLPSMVLERDARIQALEEELAAKSLPWWKKMFRKR